MTIVAVGGRQPSAKTLTDRLIRATYICIGLSAGSGAGGVFRIELIRGASWQEPLETIDQRECETNSIDAAVAEAKHWLKQIQQAAPARGITHYRVVSESGTTIGGPP